MNISARIAGGFLNFLSSKPMRSLPLNANDVKVKRCPEFFQE
jgi:hypothetical protein